MTPKNSQETQHPNAFKPISSSISNLRIVSMSPGDPQGLLDDIFYASSPQYIPRNMHGFISSNGESQMNTINLKCKKCNKEFYFDVGDITIHKKLQFEKEIQCPSCGQLAEAEYEISEKGEDELFDIFCNAMFEKDCSRESLQGDEKKTENLEKASCSFCSKVLMVDKDELDSIEQSMCGECFNKRETEEKLKLLFNQKINLVIFREDAISALATNMTDDIIDIGFEDLWQGKKEEFKALSKKELSMEMFGQGSFVAHGSLFEKMLEYPSIIPFLLRFESENDKELDDSINLK